MLRSLIVPHRRFAKRGLFGCFVLLLSRGCVRSSLGASVSFVPFRGRASLAAPFQGSKVHRPLFISGLRSAAQWGARRIDVLMIDCSARPLTFAGLYPLLHAPLIAPLRSAKGGRHSRARYSCGAASPVSNYLRSLRSLAKAP